MTLSIYEVRLSAPFNRTKNFVHADSGYVYRKCNEWLDAHRLGVKETARHKDMRISVKYGALVIELVDGAYYSAHIADKDLSIAITDRLGLAFRYASAKLAQLDKQQKVGGNYRFVAPVKGTPISVPTVADKRSVIQMPMRIGFLCGETLLAEAARHKGYRERDCTRAISKFLATSDARKVLILYGLRRTGKTELMWQSINRLLGDGVSTRQIAFYEVKKRDDVDDVIDEALKLVHGGVKYLFIDEVTYAVGFLSSAHLLSDRVSGGGVRVVLAGTDSLLFHIARQRTLFDRCQLISTTRIAYDEYRRVMGDVSVPSYLRTGGVFSHGTADEYVHSAIIENVANSLNSIAAHEEFMDLYRELNSGNFAYLMNGVISGAVKAPIYEGLANLMRPHILGQAQMDEVIRKMEKLDKFAFVEEAYQNLRVLYAAEDVAKTTRNFNEGVIEVLLTLGFMRETKLRSYTAGREGSTTSHRVAVTQCGIVYDYAKDVKGVVTQLLSERDANAQDIVLVNQAIERVALSHIFESEIYAVCADWYTRIQGDDVFKLQYTLADRQRAEIDVVVYDAINKGLHFIEVKNQSRRTKRQYEWLINREIEDRLEAQWGQILSRNVVYMGDTEVVNNGDMRIKYWNSEDFLIGGYKSLTQKG